MRDPKFKPAVYLHKFRWNFYAVMNTQDDNIATITGIMQLNMPRSFER